jgi:BolA protein
MSMEHTIETKVLEAFTPERIRIDNDSKGHAGPATESHFRLIIVSDTFDGLNSVKRHRLVYGCLADELAGPVHALQLKCLTPAEYDDADGDVSLQAPPCGGGKKHA